MNMLPEGHDLASVEKALSTLMDQLQIQGVMLVYAMPKGDFVFFNAVHSGLTPPLGDFLRESVMDALNAYANAAMGAMATNGGRPQ